MDQDRRKQMKEAYAQRVSSGGAYVIKNSVNGKQLLLCETDLTGAKNRFDFMKMTGSCPNQRLRFAWKEFGPQVFQFEVLEELKRKETQTREEFVDDLKILEELWREKLGQENLY